MGKTKSKKTELKVEEIDAEATEDLEIQSELFDFTDKDAQKLAQEQQYDKDALQNSLQDELDDIYADMRKFLIGRLKTLAHEKDKAKMAKASEAEWDKYLERYLHPDLVHNSRKAEAIRMYDQKMEFKRLIEKTKQRIADVYRRASTYGVTLENTFKTAKPKVNARLEVKTPEIIALEKEFELAEPE